MPAARKLCLDYAVTPATSNFVGSCGNGVVEIFEECDDSNEANGDGCSDLCRTEAVSCCPPGFSLVAGNCYLVVNAQVTSASAAQGYCAVTSPASNLLYLSDLTELAAVGQLLNPFNAYYTSLSHSTRPALNLVNTSSWNTLVGFWVYNSLHLLEPDLSGEELHGAWAGGSPTMGSVPWSMNSRVATFSPQSKNFFELLVSNKL